MLAFCPVCKNLRKIESRGLLPGEPRREDLRVLPHAADGDDTGGKVCEGTGRRV